jgi:hypothetical protein
MTTIKQNVGIGLQSVGTTLTTGNSSGTGQDAFSYINGTPSQLSDGIDLGGSAVAKAVGWTSLTADLTFGGRFCFTLTTAPSATTPVVQVRSASGPVFNINIRADRKFTVTDSTGTTIGAASTTVLAIGTQYRFGFYSTVATSTTGAVTVNLYAEGSTTIIESVTTTTSNLGTAGATTFRFGHDSASGSIGLTGRHLGVGDTAALLGEYSAPSVPPTVALSVGTRYKVDARGSTVGSGGTLSYAIAQDTGATVTAEEPFDGLFLIPQSGEVTDWTVTATESPSGLIDTDTVTVPALATGEPEGYLETVVWNGSALV